MPGKCVFNRIFDRVNFSVAVVEIIQARIKRCGFSRAGRTGNENQAARAIEQAKKLVEVARGHA